MRQNKSITAGFSLIELAMVLFIVGLMLGGLLLPLSTQLEGERRAATQDQLNMISDSIHGFALRNRRLPCPDTDGDGLEDRPGGSCVAANGALPSTDLDIKARDQWDNLLVYHVDTDFADNTDGTVCEVSPPPAGVSFSLCSNGNIRVLDSTGGTLVAGNIPALILSSGKNFTQGMPSADESENLNGDTTYVDRDYSQKDNKEFDDLLIWISPHVLRVNMLKAGILP